MYVVEKLKITRLITIMIKHKWCNDILNNYFLLMKLYLIVTSNFKCLLGKTVYTVYITKEIFISCQHSGNADQENLLQNLLNELIKWRILSDMVVIQGSKGVGRGGGERSPKTFSKTMWCQQIVWWKGHQILFFLF